MRLRTGRRYTRRFSRSSHDDIPYVFVTGSVGNTGYSDKFNGTDPGPWSFYHNIQTWSLAE